LEARVHGGMIGDLDDDLAEGEGVERVERYLAALLD
jgi:hypothetical protein